MGRRPDTSTEGSTDLTRALAVEAQIQATAVALDATVSAVSVDVVAAQADATAALASATSAAAAASSASAMATSASSDAAAALGKFGGRSPSAFGLDLITNTTAAGARTDLGLGTAATHATGDYLAAAGTAADSSKLAGTTPSSYGLTLIDDADAATARTTLGLGTAAVAATTDFDYNGAGLDYANYAIGYVASTGTALTATKLAGVTPTSAFLTIVDDTTVGAMLDTLGGATHTGTGGVVCATSPTLTTPAIGVATGTSLAATGAITSSSVSAAIGYAAGAGTAVTQGAGSGKATGVTLNTVSGQITMNNAALAAAAEISFTVTCSSVKIQDVIVVCHQSAGTFGAYAVHAGGITDATSFKIFVGNMSAGSLSEAIVLNYVIIRGVKA